MRDLNSLVTVFQALSPGAAITATALCVEIDLAGNDSCMVAVNVGTFATFTGSNSWSLCLWECATTGGTYTAVADADLINPTGAGGGEFKLCDAAADDEATWKGGYCGSLQFLKLKIVETGTVSCVAGAVAILGGAKYPPV